MAFWQNRVFQRLFLALIIGALAAGNALFQAPGVAEQLTWGPAGTTSVAHAFGTATLLQNGRVLLVGGLAGGPYSNTSAAELYNAATNSWTAAASTVTPCANHTATMLPDGTFLVGGGRDCNGLPMTAAEVYNDAPPGQCFAQTGQCVHGDFFDYWHTHGGLAINGYPLSGLFPEQLEDGKVYLVQYFERVRMEYHPENPAPYNVLLGQFGRRTHPAEPAATPLQGARYFPETGHNVVGNLLVFWEEQGGLAQFGYPLTEEFDEVLEDGKAYQVQYFERHPENNLEYYVLLGQFGRQVLAGR